MTPAGAQMTAGASSSAAALLSALPATVDAAVVRDGPHFVVAAAPDALRVASGPDAMDTLDRLTSGCSERNRGRFKPRLRRANS